MSLSPPVTIEHVEVWPDHNGRLSHFHLGHPLAETVEEVHSIPFQGWTVGAALPAREVTLNDGQGQHVTLPVCMDRPEIAALYPDQPWAARSGFGGRIGSLHLPLHFDLELSVVMEDGRRAYVGSVNGHRRRLPRLDDARFQPVAVTTLGRSGSTWLTWMLGQHPELLAYKSFGFEPKVAAYFAEVARSLTQPASYYQAVRGDIDDDGWWTGRDPRFGLPWYSCDPHTDRWLGADYVEDVLALAGRGIDSLYDRLAAAQSKPDALCFVEKFPPTYFVQRMLWEMYPRTREIFLVRDLRDVACSMLAFGRKRGLSWYWNAEVSSDERIIREPLREEVAELVNCWEQRADLAYLLRYEDLIERPRETLAALFSYIGVDDSAATLDEVLDRSTGLDPALARGHATTGTPTESIGRWRKELTPSLRAACEESFGPALTRFGYS